MFVKSFIRIFIFFMMTLGISAYGQQKTLVYEGDYTVNAYQGNAKFAFEFVDGDTIFNGDFYMHQSNLKKLISGTDHPFSIKGAFKSAVPVGQWKFEFGDFKVQQLEGNAIAKNKYEITIDGTNHVAYGNLLGGKPNGKWVQKVETLEGSEVQSNKFYSEIDFNAGVPQRNFRVENEQTLLIGRFLRDGLAHDAWEMFSKDDPDQSEVWRFNDGVLKQIEFINKDSALQIEVYNKVLHESIVVNLDNRYLSIVNLHQQLIGSSEIDLKDGIIQLLGQNANYYGKIDNVFSALAEVDFMPHFKVKVPVYPLTEDELTVISAIENQLKKDENKIIKFLESSQLNILKLADDDVMFQLSVLESMSANHLNVIRTVVDAYHNKVLQHVERDNLLPRLCARNLCNSQVIEVQYDQSDSLTTKTFSIPNASDYNFQEPGINGLSNFSQFVSACITKIEQELNTKLDINAREQELIELEESLIISLGQLNEHVDSLRLIASGEIDEGLLTIKEFAKSELSSYSAYKDMNTKADLAKSLINCLDELRDLASTVNKTPARQQEISKLYTDAVWNPFTSTVMNEEVKKRIKTAYNEAVIPYLLNEVKENLSCEKVTQLKSLYDGVHERMLELHDEETDKMERKLKKEKDPLIILDLFAIKMKSEADL